MPDTAVYLQGGHIYYANSGIVFAQNDQTLSTWGEGYAQLNNFFYTPGIGLNDPLNWAAINDGAWVYTGGSLGEIIWIRERGFFDPAKVYKRVATQIEATAEGGTFHFDAGTLTVHAHDPSNPNPATLDLEYTNSATASFQGVSTSQSSTAVRCRTQNIQAVGQGFNGAGAGAQFYGIKYQSDGGAEPNVLVNCGGFYHPLHNWGGNNAGQQLTLAYRCQSGVVYADVNGHQQIFFSQNGPVQALCWECESLYGSALRPSVSEDRADYSVYAHTAGAATIEALYTLDQAVRTDAAQRSRVIRIGLGNNVSRPTMGLDGSNVRTDATNVHLRSTYEEHPTLLGHGFDSFCIYVGGEFYCIRVAGTQAFNASNSRNIFISSAIEWSNQRANSNSGVFNPTGAGGDGNQVFTLLYNCFLYFTNSATAGGRKAWNQKLQNTNSGSNTADWGARIFDSVLSGENNGSNCVIGMNNHPTEKWHENNRVTEGAFRETNRTNSPATAGNWSPVGQTLIAEIVTRDDLIAGKYFGEGGDPNNGGVAKVDNALRAWVGAPPRGPYQAPDDTQPRREIFQPLREGFSSGGEIFQPLESGVT